MMSNSLLKPILGLVFMIAVSVFVAVFANITHAAVITENPNGATFVGFSGFYRAQEFLMPFDATVNAVTFYTNTGSIPSFSANVKIWALDGTELATTTINQSHPDFAGIQAGDPFTVVFPVPVSLSGSVTYAFGMTLVSGTSFNIVAESPGTYAGGCVRHYTGSGALTAAGCQSYDLKFAVNGSVGEVEITWPTVLVVNDFNAFILTYSAPPGNYIFNVDYATSSDNLSSASTRFTDSTGLSLGFSAVDSQIGVAKTRTFDLVGQTWYMKARIVDDQDELIGDSSITSMTIQSTSFTDTLPFLQPTQSNSTSTDLIVTCDPSDPLFTRSFCNLFAYLFVPSTDAWNGFKSLQSELQNKPPFGYIVSTIDALEGFSSGVTSTLSLPDLSPLADDFWNPIKTLVSWILYVIFGFWFYNKFRHFQF